MPAGKPAGAQDANAQQETHAAQETNALDLVAPQPATAVEPAQAERQIPVDPVTAGRIDAMVTGFADAVAGLDVHTDDYRRRVGEIDAIGDREMVATSQMSNRLLDRPVRSVDGILGSKAPIAKSLVELRHTVEDLNPAKYDLTEGGPRKLLGVIPFGDRLRAYFDKYGKAQGHIQGIVDALHAGRQELERDNAAITQEQRGLWTEMETLRQYAYLAQKLDDALDGRIAQIAVTDEARARTLREDVLFPVRRRRQEILTQLAVATQGYAALRVVEKNNVEVMRAIGTATTTTVAALRTAVMVAQAAANQRLVSEQVAAVNEVTSGMIESTSALLREQTGQVEQQATSPGVDLAALQRAWDNVFAALDQIDAYKLNALEAMKVTVRELSGQVQKSREYVERLHEEESTRPARAPDRTSSLRLK